MLIEGSSERRSVLRGVNGSSSHRCWLRCEHVWDMGQCAAIGGELPGYRRVLELVELRVVGHRIEYAVDR